MQFSLYLKNKGVITAEQLVAALEQQLNSLVPIGQLAMEENVLSPRAIFTVLQAQSDSPDARFGELAIELGLMTRGDLMRLLMVQADRKRPIVELLVDQGALTQSKAASELAAYRRAQLRPQRTTSATKVTLPARNSETTRPTSDELITV
jgi:hypothetical protein